MSEVDHAHDVAHNECRTLRHAWKVLETRGMSGLLLRCIRCRMVRRDTFNPWTGHLDKRSYEAPEGYYLNKGEARPDIGEYRLRLMARYADTTVNQGAETNV